jgi:hypothetical protein
VQLKSVAVYMCNSAERYGINHCMQKRRKSLLHLLTIVQIASMHSSEHPHAFTYTVYRPVHMWVLRS